MRVQTYLTNVQGKTIDQWLQIAIRIKKSKSAEPNQCSAKQSGVEIRYLTKEK